MSQPTKAFISYSHDSSEHARRVLDLADALRRDGIEVILDQYVHPAPDEGWPRWMEGQIEEASFVLMVCTETYRRRVMGREQPGRGLGVRWEGALIYHRIYTDKPSGSRFVPILLEGSEPPHIPNPVQGHTYYHINEFNFSDPGYDGLYRHLTRQAPTPPPSIGKIRTLAALPRQASPEGMSLSVRRPTKGDKIEGFERRLSTSDVRLSDDELIRLVRSFNPDSGGRTRWVFAKELAWFLSVKHDLFVVPYTAWKEGRTIFLSTLPAYRELSQKTLEFDFDEASGQLCLEAEWSPTCDGWEPFGDDHYVREMTGLMVDKSGCDMYREAALHLLAKRGVVFRFPVAPKGGDPERFCTFRREELNKTEYEDWDRCPMLVGPKIDSSVAFYDRATGQGVLIFRVGGRWSRDAFSSLFGSLRTLLPSRTKHVVKIGEIELIVHVSSVPKRRFVPEKLKKQIDDGTVPIDDDTSVDRTVDRTVDLCLSSVARMVAVQRNIQPPFPDSESGLPQLKCPIDDLFEETVKALDEIGYQPVLFGGTDKTERWEKPYHSRRYNINHVNFHYILELQKDELLRYILQKEGPP